MVFKTIMAKDNIMFQVKIVLYVDETEEVSLTFAALNSNITSWFRTSNLVKSSKWDDILTEAKVNNIAFDLQR
jgi:hypothetical protein